jgi:DNA-binding GntR family transcriptional regulator
MSISTAHRQKKPILCKLEHRSLKEATVTLIRTAIMQGELKPGQRVTELGLAKSMGVAQATVREALIELEHQGFIQRGSPRTTFVTILSQQDITEMYRVRATLEILVVQLLVSKKEKDFANCESIHQRMVGAAKRGTVSEFIQADLDFHRGLWRSAGNRSLFESLERLVPKLFSFFIMQNDTPTRQHMLQIAKEHGDLLQLIRDGRAREAIVAIQESMHHALTDDTEHLSATLTFMKK